MFLIMLIFIVILLMSIYPWVLWHRDPFAALRHRDEAMDYLREINPSYPFELRQMDTDPVAR